MEDLIRPESNDAGMIRWISNVRAEDKISEEELLSRLKFNSLNECLQPVCLWKSTMVLVIYKEWKRMLFLAKVEHSKVVVVS